MVFLGAYSYGIYVYHHFISRYLDASGTAPTLARWLGSDAIALALQATMGVSASLALAYASYELFEKRVLRLRERFGAGRGEPLRLDSEPIGWLGTRVK